MEQKKVEISNPIKVISKNDLISFLPMTVIANEIINEVKEKTNAVFDMLSKEYNDFEKCSISIQSDKKFMPLATN
ncbi:hypothetical protein OAM98_03795 [Schleiferiaceae bacterium]|nr:hypothetical protein [Schleiferiaceae bacterium]